MATRGGGRGSTLSRGYRIPALLLFSCLLAGETAAQSGHSFGIEAGLVRSKHKSGPEFSTTWRDGFVVGASLEVVTPISLLAVRASGRWVRRGSDYLLPSFQGPLMSPVRTDHLSFPILIGPRVSVGSLTLSALLGPQIDYLLSSRTDTNFTSRFPDEKRMEVSVAAGVGLEITLGGVGRLGAEARWVEGLTAIYEGVGPDPRGRSYELVVRVGN